MACSLKAWLLGAEISGSSHFQVGLRLCSVALALFVGVSFPLFLALYFSLLLSLWYFSLSSPSLALYLFLLLTLWCLSFSLALTLPLQYLPLSLSLSPSLPFPLPVSLPLSLSPSWHSVPPFRNKNKGRPCGAGHRASGSRPIWKFPMRLWNGGGSSVISFPSLYTTPFFPV